MRNLLLVIGILIICGCVSKQPISNKVMFSKSRVPLWLTNLPAFKKGYKDKKFVIGESVPCETIPLAKISAKNNALNMYDGDMDLFVEDEYLRKMPNGKYEIAILFILELENYNIQKKNFSKHKEYKIDRK